MKNIFKLIGIIALVAVIGFSMTACGGGDDGNNNNDNNNNNNNNNNGTITTASLYGKWWRIRDTQYWDSLVFAKDGVKDNFIWDSSRTSDAAVSSGTYSVSGSTISFVQWDNADRTSGNITISGSKNTITLSGFTKWTGLNGSWYKDGASVSSGAVTLKSVTANGSSTLNTTELVLTFDEKINGLTAADITLSGVAGVTKGTLSGGPDYTLPISGFTAGGTLTVTVAKPGFTISGSPNTVTIYALNWNSAVDVYVVGNSKDGITDKATIWKNGIRTILSTSSPLGSNAYSVYVSGSDVYVAGIDGSMTTGGTPKLWKNGTAQSLSSTNCTVKSVFVSGTDVYVAGGTVSSPRRAVYWKNGTQTTLNNPTFSGTSTTPQVEANSIFVSGTTVYVAGTSNSAMSRYATLWTNGSPQVHSTSSTYGNSIFVSGSTVYMAMDASNNACLWRSDTNTTTRLSTSTSGANSVFVSGTDVYVAGRISGSATLWKNGTPQTLNSTSSSSWAESVYVYGSDVYVAGHSSDGALLWINGEVRYLQADDRSGGAYSVFVKARQ